MIHHMGIGTSTVETPVAQLEFQFSREIFCGMTNSLPDDNSSVGGQIV
jgi:hypothetical protein